MDTVLSPGVCPLEPSDGETRPGADRLRLPADALPIALLLTACADGQVLYANAPFARLWGVESGRSLVRLVEAMGAAAADPKLVAQLWAERRVGSSQEGGLHSFLLLRDGREIQWRTTVLSEEGESDRVELHLFEESPSVSPPLQPLHDRSDLFRLSFEKAAVGMTLVSSDFRFLRANASFCRMLGLEERRLLELRVFDVGYEDDGSEASGWHREADSDQESFHLDARFTHRDGSPVWVHLSVSVVRDADGRPLYYIAMAEDITQRKKEQEEQQRRTQELLTLATTDPLTGLHNHRSMQQMLNQRVGEAARTGQPLSILMLDVDHFRALNERHGHDAGDRGLRVLADCLRKSLRDDDVACRYGGEEFLMILSCAALPAAMAAAGRVREAVEAAPPIAPGAAGMTCSIGVASYPAHASTVASLIKAADVALYQAKRGGRNCVCGFQVGFFVSPADPLETLTACPQGANLEAVNALVTAIDLRDRYTGAHCQRVGRLALELGIRLGRPEAEVETLRLGASLLDVGKIGLPDYLLTKPGRLTREEWTLMRQHPLWSEELVRRSSLPLDVLQLVRWHHERLDGSGYPDGIEGALIPMPLRIVHVADIAVALSDHRPHRPAWTRDRILRHLEEQSGTKLDPDVVRTYCELGPDLSR